MLQRALVLLLLVLGPLWLAHWVVDDAAISYAFAENLAAGEGLVAVPGSERVEGYSNPLWVGLLAVGALFGADLFVLSKVLAIGCSVGTGVLLWRAERSWIAPALLAINAQHLIWTASGLENPLFTLLLVAGLLALREERWDWGGLAFGLLALTRPEGVVYGAVAGVLYGAGWRFWPVLLGLFGAHELFRIAYFAWPLPNTYYAKLGVPVDRSWEGRGVRQLLHWGWGSGFVFLLPLLWFRKRLAVMVTLALGFSWVAGGDWMRGFRWMSLAAGPLAWAAAGGLLWVRERHGQRLQWVLAGVLIGGLLPSHLLAVRAFTADPVDHPEMIGRRLAYIEHWADRMDIPARDRSTLEMDMGAHLWKSDLAVVDLAGLVDVPIAHHSFADRDFMAQYLFEERKPLFAHVHRHWARESRVPSYPGWKKYVQLPPYEDDGREHGGVFVRRDVVDRPWDGPVLDVPLGGVRLIGARIRAPEVTHTLHLELAFRGKARPLTVTAGTQSWTVLPGHGVLKRGRMVGTHLLPVSLSLGTHTVKLDDTVLGTIEVVEDATPHAQADLDRIGVDCDAAEEAWWDARAHHSALDGSEHVAACWLARGTVLDVVRARYWNRQVAGYAAVAGPLADARYADGLRAMETDPEAAYRAFSEVLDLQPHRAWARRRAEQTR